MTGNPIEAGESVPVAGRPLLNSTSKAVIAIIGIAVLYHLLFPTMGTPVEVVWRRTCRYNLKQIGLALHNYHDAYGSFPPAYTVDADGNRLHSWRTLILPFVDQQALYEQIDLSKSWDDPANAILRQSVPDVWRCPAGSTPQHHTTYLGIALVNGVFEPGRTTSISDMTDGTSNTLMVVEVEETLSVPWMSPWDEDGRSLSRLIPERDVAHDTYSGIVYGLYGDGSVSSIPLETTAAELKPFMTISGNEAVTELY